MFSYIYLLCIGLVSYNDVANVNALVTLQSSNVMPTPGNSLTLSCLIQDVVSDNPITCLAFPAGIHKRCTDNHRFECVQSLNSVQDLRLYIPSSFHHMVLQVAVTSVTLSISTSEVVFYEGYPQTLTCINSPSRPISTIRWFLGSRPLTDNITTTSTTDATGLYILTSQIFLTLMRDASNQQIKCEGFIDGQQAVMALEKPSVNVWYAPDVKITLTGSTQQNQTAMLICEAQGVPAQYTFYAWIHMWEDAVIRTGLQGTTSASQCILTIERLSLESMGTYICPANNGITGINGNIYQTGSENLTVTGIPNILDNNAVFFGEIGTSVNISIPLYSDPVIESFVIQRNGTEIINNSRIMTLLSWDIINYALYGIIVKMKAQKAHFMIQNLTEGDFDNYTLELKNNKGKTIFRFQLDAFGFPLIVHRFYFNRFIDNQIELHFDPGFNGGCYQTFVVEKKSAASPNGVWQNTSVSKLLETERQNQFKNGTFFVNISKPVIAGIYQYRMYSWNIKGKSPFSKSITVTVSEDLITNESLGIPVAEIAGGVSAGFVVIFVVAIGIFLWRRYQQPTKNEHDKDINREHEESTRKNQINTNSVKQDVASGREYEGLHFTKAEVDQYQELNGITSENTRNADKRSPESDSYEKLHPYANNDIQMYSSLKIHETSKDSQKDYENTWIKA